MARSALVVLVPEAEEAVGQHRAINDPMAGRGVPAHVTILHPFRADVDQVTANEVASIAGTIEPFNASFGAVGRFAVEVVFLVPEPVATFMAMTRSFMAAFPDCPPYGGAHPDPEPHLTVGSNLDPAVADSLAQTLPAGLPLNSRVDRLTLLVEDSVGNWTIDSDWPLGNGPGTV